MSTFFKPYSNATISIKEIILLEEYLYTYGVGKMKIMKREMFVVIMLVLGCIAALPATVLANEQAWQTSIQIPVIVNIYNNSINGTQLNNSINESNKLLKQADIKLVVIKTNDPPGAGNGDDGDGNFTEAERKDILEFGGKELNLTKNQKGIKLSFGHNPEAENSSTLGLAHPPEWGANWTEGKPGNPTILLKYSGDADTGITIAHELGHVMGIKGDYNNTDRIMDYLGRGKNFSKDEIKQMQKYDIKYKFGKCSVQWKEAFPAIKEETQFGTITDDADDQGNPVSAIYDLHQVYMTSAVGFVDISAEITVADPLPADEEIDAVYSLGFDVDDNSGTGVTYAGYNGIDRIVWINITGNISSSTFAVTGELENTTMGTTQSLPEMPVVATQIEIADFNGGTQPWATTFFFEIPKGMLSLSASEAPVVATAGNSTSIHDTAGFIFDSQRWLKDPTFTTFGTGVPTPGSNYPFDISGLEPNDPFDLYLDDILILSGTLDGSGSFSGNFVFPADMSNSEMHFLTAQDSTGEFAYSFTCPKPPTDITSITPLGLVALIGILALLGSWYIRRK